MRIIQGELEKAEQLGGGILQLSVAVGGAITGEHGVGVEKTKHMCFQFTKGELTQFHAVKRAFDERGLLNPGRPCLHCSVVPNLALCMCINEN